jgi:hypothetical protein
MSSTSATTSCNEAVVGKIFQYGVSYSKSGRTKSRAAVYTDHEILHSQVRGNDKA